MSNPTEITNDKPTESTSDMVGEERLIMESTPNLLGKAVELQKQIDDLETEQSNKAITALQETVKFIAPDIELLNALFKYEKDLKALVVNDDVSTKDKLSQSKVLILKIQSMEAMKPYEDNEIHILFVIKEIVKSRLKLHDLAVKLGEVHKKSSLTDDEKLDKMIDLLL
jgi:hypothetical protein